MILGIVITIAVVIVLGGLLIFLHRRCQKGQVQPKSGTVKIQRFKKSNNTVRLDSL